MIITDGVPNQIQEVLNVIKKEINYNAIYQYEVFPKFPDSTRITLKEIIQSLRGLSSELVIQHDILGLMFQRLIPLELRKKLAAYYTKPLAAELLARLTIESGEDSVVDPACGSGTLLVQSYLEKRRLEGIKAQHEKLLSEIAGSDISVFATILASVNLAIQDPGLWTNRVNIFNENAFYVPKAHIGRYFENNHFIYKFKKQTSDGTEIVESPGLLADVVIMNPPFTRGSRLTKDERKILLKVSKFYDLKHGWRDWNLYASFILLAPEFLPVKKKSKIGLVLPRAAISTAYMEKVWEKLFEKYPSLGMRYVINASMKEISFSDSGEQEILLVMEKKYNAPCKMIQLKKDLENCDIEELAEEIMQIDKKGFSLNSEYIEGQIIEQKTFKEMKCREWRFLPSSLLDLIQRDFIKIDQLNFVISGSENSSKPVEFFWVPNKYWELDNDSDKILTVKKTLEIDKLIRETFSEDFQKISEKIPERINIPKRYLVKSLVRSIRHLRNFPPKLSENFPYLYFLNYREFSKHPNEKYFKWGEIFKKTVENWVYASPRPANIFIPKRVGLTSNKTIAIYSSELLESTRFPNCIFIPVDNSQETKKNMEVLYAYLTSSIFLLDYIKKSRVDAGAFRRLYATDLKDLMKFPNILNLLNKDKELIINASNEHNKQISLKNRPTFPELISNTLNKTIPSTLRKLDETWFKILGIPISTLDGLYRELLKEFQRY